MRIHHIFHDGFCILMQTCTLIFDWYTGTLPEIPKDLPVYVLVTHGHNDHYGACIWELQKSCDQVIYILDETVGTARVPEGVKVHWVRENEKYEIEGLSLETLHSTDLGSAFYVEIEGKTIFHAGDLNIWYWYDEPEEENLASEAACIHEFQKLAGRQIDVAFLALDPRLKEEAPRGIEAFCKYASAKQLVPMHYESDLSLAKAYQADPRLEDAKEKLRFEDVFEL